LCHNESLLLRMLCTCVLLQALVMPRLAWGSGCHWQEQSLCQHHRMLRCWMLGKTITCISGTAAAGVHFAKSAGASVIRSAGWSTVCLYCGRCLSG
jgi:hypothetical protein